MAFLFSLLVALFASNLARAAYITANLNNLQDMQYSITLYVGSAKKQMTFIIDTGSSWLWIPSSTCSGCTNKAKAFTPSGEVSYVN